MTDDISFVDEDGEIIDLEMDRPHSRGRVRAVLVVGASAAVFLGGIWVSSAAIEGYLQADRLSGLPSGLSLTERVVEHGAGLLDTVVGSVEPPHADANAAPDQIVAVPEARPDFAIADALVEAFSLPEAMAAIEQALPPADTGSAAVADDEAAGLFGGAAAGQLAADLFAPHQITLDDLAGRRPPTPDAAGEARPAATQPPAPPQSLAAETETALPADDIAHANPKPALPEQLFRPAGLLVAESMPDSKPAPAVDMPPSAGWRVQLAALSNRNRADAAWPGLLTANRDLLAALSPHVERAELATGTFYRVQAGPLSDRAAAVALCRSLKSRRQDCLVVAP